MRIGALEVEEFLDLCLDYTPAGFCFMGQMFFIKKLLPNIPRNKPISVTSTARFVSGKNFTDNKYRMYLDIDFDLNFDGTPEFSHKFSFVMDREDLDRLLITDYIGLWIGRKNWKRQQITKVKARDIFVIRKPPDTNTLINSVLHIGSSN